MARGGVLKCSWPEPLSQMSKNIRILFFNLFLDRPKILLFFFNNHLPPQHTHTYSTVKKKVVSFCFEVFRLNNKRRDFWYGDCLGTLKKCKLFSYTCLNNNGKTNTVAGNYNDSREKRNRLPKQI